MSDPAPDASGRRSIGDILTLGFGTAAAMWGVGFLTHLPLGAVDDGGDASAAPWVLPGPVVFGLLVAVLIGGGWVAGRTSGRGWRGGLWSGGVTGLVNLLVLGAVVRSFSDETPLMYAALWVPATILASAVLGAVGAALGSKPPGTSARARNWPMAFSLVTCGVTLLLIAVGGSVTGMEAGLAVPDWPNSFGYNMFLLPLAKMTGGIYFEHAHRLLGTLVGLTALVFTAYLQFTSAQRWVKNLTLVVFALVVVQGILGAVRVIGWSGLSQNPEDLAPSLTMGMIHGTLAQIVFAMLATIACALSSTWRRAGPPLAHPNGASDRTWGAVTLVLVFAQIVLGVILRHRGDELTWALHLHLTMAVVVAIVATIYSLRMWSLDGQVPGTPRVGKLILHVLGTQFLLGIGALWAVLVENPEQGPHPVQVLITTLHQTMGALLLAIVTATWAWHLRTIATGGAPSASDARARAVPAEPER